MARGGVGGGVGRMALQDAQLGFLGGLNRAADISQLAADELWDATNARLSEAGGLTRRLGSQRAHAAALAGAVLGGHQYVHGGTTEQIAIAGGALLAGSFSIGMTWTSRGTGFSTTVAPSFADFTDAGFNPCCYIADGGALCKLNASTLTMRLAGTPNVARLWVYNRRLFGTGDPANPKTVYWSAIDNGDTLGVTASGGGAAVVLPDQDAGDMVAGQTVGASAALFQTGGIARFEGLTVDDIAIGTGAQGFSSAVGLVAPRSIVRYGTGALPSVAFMSEFGVYELDLGWSLRAIARYIEPVFSAVDRASLAATVAVHNRDKRELWFAVPGAGVYVYNYRFLSAKKGGVGPWSGPFTGIFTTSTCNALWEATDAGGGKVILGGFQDGFVRQLDRSGIYMDDVLSDGTGGSAYTMLGQCHRMFFRAPTREKSLRRLWVTANTRGSTGGVVRFETTSAVGQTNVPATGGLKWDAPGAVWDAAGATWNAVGAAAPRLDAHGRGPYADITIIDDGKADSVYSRVDVLAYDMGPRT